MARVLRRRKTKPLDIHLTMRVRFGERPGDQVTVVENRKLKMIGSVFQYRDQAMNFLVYQMLRAGVRQPRVYGEMAPGALSAMKKFAKRFRQRR